MTDEKKTKTAEREKTSEAPPKEVKEEKKAAAKNKKGKSGAEKKEAPEKPALTPDEVDKLILENADLQVKCREMNDKFLLLAAEFENFKKRTQKDQLRVREFYKESLLLDLLPVLDDIERAISHHQDDETGKVLAMMQTQLLSYLAKYDVQPFEAVGKNFDPDMHDAMMTRHEEDKKNNIVLEEFQKGYKIGDKVLRHARVVVNITE